MYTYIVKGRPGNARGRSGVAQAQVQATSTLLTGPLKRTT
jgi:hypothetical protein